MSMLDATFLAVLAYLFFTGLLVMWERDGDLARWGARADQAFENFEEKYL